MPPGPGETANNRNWQGVVYGFLRFAEAGVIPPDLVVDEAGRLVDDMLQQGIIDDLAQLQTHLDEQQEIMRLVALPMDHPLVPEGARSVDPRDQTPREYGLLIIFGQDVAHADRHFAEHAPDPELNLQRLRSETGMLRRPDPVSEFDQDNMQPWHHAVLQLEELLTLSALEGAEYEQLYYSTLATLASLVRTGQTTWAAVQSFQSRRHGAAFQLLAQPLNEAAPPSPGSVCIDVVSETPRQAVVSVVLAPSTLAAEDPRMVRLADHDANLALLREAGVWMTHGVIE